MKAGCKSEAAKRLLKARNAEKDHRLDLVALNMFDVAMVAVLSRA